MTISTYTQPPAGTLWKMEPHEFNEWRATNDLPALFTFLANLLPGFAAWEASLPIKRTAMLRVISTGQLFMGDSFKTVVKHDAPLPGRFYYVCVPATDVPESHPDIGRKTFEVIGNFLPYFAWAKRHLGRNRFFVWDTVNNQKTDTFIYGSWNGTPVTEDGTGQRAILFRDFPVLKLGDKELHSVNMGERNLDFVNLDHLTLHGNYFGSSWKYINFSSCRNVRLMNAQAWFFTFHRCAVDTFHVENSKIQDIYFERVNNLTISLTGSHVFRLGFTNTSVVPIIKDCELRDVSYRPLKGVPPGVVATTYRMLRAAYQSAGQRQEAAACYYNERKFERKALFRPYGEHSNELSMHFRGQFSEARDAFEEGRFDSRTLRDVRRKIVLEWLKMLRRPKTLWLLIRSRARWFAALFEELLWGYGERPMRVVIFVMLAVAIYAVVYHLLPWPKTTNVPAGWLDDFYFSAVTFTTLGYGDILPASDTLKLVCASEALVGGLSLGLIVAGFSNRGRY